MDKFVNIVFWLSLFILLIFILIVLAMGMIAMTNVGGMKIWLLPAISFCAFVAITTGKSIKKFYE